MFFVLRGYPCAQRHRAIVTSKRSTNAHVRGARAPSAPQTQRLPQCADSRWQLHTRSGEGAQS
jgi:hypothetical protein